MDQQSFLDGHLDYKYAHTFEVYHTVTSKEMLAQELPENLEELLASPRRQIAMDMKHDPHNHAHGFLPGYVNDLLKIVPVLKFLSLLNNFINIYPFLLKWN